MSGLAGARVEDAAGEAWVEDQEQVAGNLLQDMEESVTDNMASGPYSAQLNRSKLTIAIYLLSIVYLHRTE